MQLFNIPQGEGSKEFHEALSKVDLTIKGNVTTITADDSNGYCVKVYKSTESKMLVLKTVWPDGYEEAAFAYDAVSEDAMGEPYLLFVQMGKILMTDPKLIEFMMATIKKGMGGPRITAFGMGRK